MPNQTSFLSVVKNRGFLNLWVNQILVQLSYNSLNFALVFWVFRLTDSNTAVSALLISIYLPPVIFGLFAGILTDISDRKKILVGIDLMLAILFFSLIFFKNDYLAIIVITFLINSLSQFYGPAEASAIPILVNKDQLLIANSIFTTTLNLAFLLGFGLAGPLIDNAGVDFVFAGGAAILLVAFLLGLMFPSIKNKPSEEGQKLLLAVEKRNLQQIRQIGLNEVKATFRLIHKNLSVLFSIIILASMQIVVGVLAVIIPSFFEKILHIRATNASYVIILPLAIGIVLGGFVLGKFGHKITKRIIVGRGIIAAGLLFLLLGLSPILLPAERYVTKFTRQPILHPLSFVYQPSLSTVMIIGAFLLGLAMVCILIPAQTVLQENTNEQVRGKVYSVLFVFQYGLSIIPVILAGVLTDFFGTLPLFIAVGGVIFVAGLFTLKPEFFFEKNHLPNRIREFLGQGHWKDKHVS